MKAKWYIGMLSVLLGMTLMVSGGCGNPAGNPSSSVPGTTAAQPIPSTSPPPSSEWDNAEARKVAEDFILLSSTFKFDGLSGSLKFIEAGPSPISSYRSTIFTYVFQTGHPGHGDRTGRFLAEVIVTHKAAILVNLENNTIVRATCDDAWDMLKEKDLPVNAAGLVIGGGDTSLPDGPLDTPRKFVYSIVTEEGRIIRVSYMAYPPSPVGEAYKAKITLDFYNGTIAVGDKLTARGALDEKTGVIVIAEQGDFIKTTQHKSMVLGVVVDIQEIILSASREGKPDEYIYELLREDGTHVFVRNTLQPGIAFSQINAVVRIGDFMKAQGLYDKESNTVIVNGEGDLIKTYDHNPVLVKAVME